MPPLATLTSLAHWDYLNGSTWARLGQDLLGTGWEVLKIVVLFLVLRRGLGRVIERIVVPVVTRTERGADAAQAARVRTLVGLLHSVLSYVLIFVAGVMLLRAFGVDPIPLLTTASVAGLAVGFGAQKLVKDVISGFFILLENQYAVGDYVTIGAVSGVVEDVGMRTTRVRDDAGKLFILANGDITQVCNQSRGAVTTFVEIGLAPATDLPAAVAVIDAAGISLADERPDLGFAQPPRTQGLSAVDATKLTIRVLCLVSHPAKLQHAQIALRDRLYAALAEAKIAVA